MVPLHRLRFFTIASAISALFSTATAFAPPVSGRCRIARATTATAAKTANAADVIDTEIAAAKTFLLRAAETKEENPDDVLEALESLERNSKVKFKSDPSGCDILDNITGEWRLIFTTGTKERQAKAGGRVNYFPLKAIQTFDAASEPKLIENAIYAWSLPLVQFSGFFDFDERKRKIEFDFDLIQLFGLIKIRFKPEDAAKIGSATGLGSKNNEKLIKTGKRAFFNWISADADIATARGGGGGLALWKRVVDE